MKMFIVSLNKLNNNYICGGGKVAHTCNPYIQEAEKGSEVKEQTYKQFSFW